MPHLALTTIIVSDYDDAIAFFTQVLRFELSVDEPSLTNDGRPKRWVEVRPPGSQTGVLLALADGDRQAASIGDQLAGRVGFFLHVEDFDDHYRHMVANGVVFHGAPRDEPYGRVVVFEDCVGNRWDLLGPSREPASVPTKRTPLSSTDAVAVGPYSHAVLHDGLVFCSGQTPLDPTTGRLTDGGAAAQTRQCFTNLFSVLADDGLGADDVLKVNVFLVDMGDFDEMNRAYSEQFAEPLPARTTIGVAALPLGAGVEVELIARRRS